MMGNVSSCTRREHRSSTSVEVWSQSSSIRYSIGWGCFKFYWLNSLFLRLAGHHITEFWYKFCPHIGSGHLQFCHCCPVWKSPFDQYFVLLSSVLARYIRVDESLDRLDEKQGRPRKSGWNGVNVNMQAHIELRRLASFLQVCPHTHNCETSKELQCLCACILCIL